jgi:xeroderma pigmentosum group C-complementing protein
VFELAIERLVEWWSGKFFQVLDSGHIRSRTFDDVHASLVSKGFLDRDFPLGVGPPSAKAPEKLMSAKAKSKQRASAHRPDWLDFFDEDEDIEIIRSEKSLMKHVLQRSGSRDVSAQLFTALCRAHGIPARLVVSLQSVPWQTKVGQPKSKPTTKKGKSKAGQTASLLEGGYEDEEDSIEGAGSSASFPGGGERLDGEMPKVKGKTAPKPVVRLRKQRPKGQTLRAARPPSLFFSPRYISSTLT